MLKDFYEELDGNVEIVFVSSDRSVEDMQSYMKESHGDWLGVEHGSSLANDLKQKYGISGIPTLVVCKKDGTLVTKDGRDGVCNKQPKLAVSEWEKCKVGDVRKKRPVTQVLSNVREKRPVTQVLSNMREKRPVTQFMGSVHEKRPVTQVLSNVREKRPATQVLSDVREKRPVTQVLSNMREKRPVTQFLSSVHEKRPVTQVMSGVHEHIHALPTKPSTARRGTEEDLHKKWEEKGKL